jgi:hypothetical protein
MSGDRHPRDCHYRNRNINYRVISTALKRNLAIITVINKIIESYLGFPGK